MLELNLKRYSMEVTQSGYYPPPFSVQGLPPIVHRGLIAIGSLATLSLVSTFCLICFIVYRVTTWNTSQKHPAPINQCVILILNLLLADLQQAMSLVLSFHWVDIDAILAPSGYCWAQAALLHFGDLASGFFVLLIALHTAYAVVVRGRVPLRWLVVSIATVWIAAFIITVVGPLTFGKPFFTRAGSWCSISPAHNSQRLTLHWLWIFVVEFGSVTIYLALFIYTRLQTREACPLLDGKSPVQKELNKAALYMCIYPLLYCALTLPLAICRMISIHGGTPPTKAYLVGGALLASCGWCDALVYATTRHVLLKNDFGNGQFPKKNRRQPRSDDTLARHGWRSSCGSGVDLTQERTLDRIVSDSYELDTHGFSAERSDRADLGDIAVRTVVEVYPSEVRAARQPSRSLEDDARWFPG